MSSVAEVRRKGPSVSFLLRMGEMPEGLQPEAEAHPVPVDFHVGL